MSGCRADMSPAKGPPVPPDKQNDLKPSPAKQSPSINKTAD